MKQQKSKYSFLAKTSKQAIVFRHLKLHTRENKFQTHIFLFLNDSIGNFVIIY